jgi:acetylornithine deacetylase
VTSSNPPADTSALISRLDRIIAEREDELIRLVGDLVRFPSLLGDEAEAQAYIAAELAQGGVETDVWEIDEAILDHDDAGRSGIPFAGRPNVSGTVRGDGSGRSLILNGHIDVVSPEPVAAWTRDPWGAAIEGDRMYGRGACDMKSGVAINIFLLKLFPELGIRLGGDLSIHNVIEEECTGNGSLAASLRHRADAAIVTEPVQGFTHAHLGVMWFRVRVTGRSAHAGWAWQGVNAISKMTPIIRALEALDARLNEFRHPLWENEHHPINLNIGTITGGDWPSTVPGSCELHCRISYYPDQSVTEMRQTIESAIHEAVTGDPWFDEHPPVVSYDGFSTRGSIVSLEESSVQVLHRHHRRVTHEDLGHSIGTAVNDMRYYNFVGVPAGCYGAAGGNVHAADEWLDLTTLVPTAQVLAGFIVDWCGVVDG